MLNDNLSIHVLYTGLHASINTRFRCGSRGGNSPESITHNQLIFKLLFGHTSKINDICNCKVLNLNRRVFPIHVLDSQKGKYIRIPDIFGMGGKVCRNSIET